MRLMESADRAQIAKAIKKARETRNLTTGELGRMIGGSAKTIWAVEHGQNRPSLSLVFEIARALNASWSEVLGPAPGAEDGWHDGRRAGIADAVGAVRDLLDEDQSQPER